MKPSLSLLIASALSIACNSNKAEETPVTKNEQQSSAVSTTQPTHPSGDGITGTWKLKLEAYDDNGNKTLDDTEQKKGIKNNYVYAFNTDGSCMIQQVFKGRYEVKTEADKKMLYVFRNRVVSEEEKDPVPDVYRIISMTKNELVLLENEGNLTFWIFERVG
jgi:hypothetical protein